MSLYILTLLVPSALYLLDLNLEKKLKLILIYLSIIYITLFMGLRHLTGGDFVSYILHYYKAKITFNFYEFDIKGGDFLYDLLNYSFANLNISIYLLNLLLSGFLVYSIYLFSSIYKQKFLGLIIAFPVIFVLVGMGYVRQGLALSLYLIALYVFLKKKYITFNLLSILAILSHKSALILLLFNLLLLKRKYIFIQSILILIFCLIILSFINKELYRLYYYYLGEGVHLESKGSVFRNAFNTIPVIIYLIFYNKFTKIITTNELKIYNFLSLLQIVLFFTSFYISTFADRITIFTFPLQLFVYLNLYILFDKKFKLLINSFILITYNIYFIVWLQFGQYSSVWYPYRNILYEYFFNYPVPPP